VPGLVHQPAFQTQHNTSHNRSVSVLGYKSGNASQLPNQKSTDLEELCWTQRSRHTATHTWGQQDIQFLKYCVGDGTKQVGRNLDIKQAYTEHAIIRIIWNCVPELMCRRTDKYRGKNYMHSLQCFILKTGPDTIYKLQKSSGTEKTTACFIQSKYRRSH
jgi:hypothetical protein